MLQSPLGRPLLARLAAHQGRGAASSTLVPSLSCRQHPNAASSRLSHSLARPSSPRVVIHTPPRRPHHAQGYSTTRAAGGRRRFRGPLLCLLFGALLTTPFYHHLTSPHPFPALEKDSPADLAQRAAIQAKAAALPLVQALLASPDWSAHHHDAYAAFAPESRPNRLTTGPLGTAAGIGGYQHVFHHRVTGEVLTVVYLGNAISGWPMVAHGGVLATLLDEQCARAAMEDADFAGTGSNRKGIVTARLEINYRQPTVAEQFYVVKARAVPEAELDDAEKGKRARKVWVRTSLETVDGRLCVEGRALYVKPAGTTLRAVEEDF